jgi:protein-tyrosine phosphatase
MTGGVEEMDSRAGGNDKNTMPEQYPRQIHFEGITVFRELGGYKARGGKTVGWRRIFRSSELLSMSPGDIIRLKEVGLKAVINLRSPKEPEKHQEISLLNEMGARYYNVPFRLSSALLVTREEELYPKFSNMGEVYLNRISDKGYGQRIIEALEIIAGIENLPLLFHCAVGKDRSGVLAAFLLSVLGVADEDVIKDYILSGPYMKGILESIKNDPQMPDNVKNLPAYHWEATPESMTLLLSTLKKEYGSTEGYLKAQGADSSLVKRLEKALLV